MQIRIKVNYGYIEKKIKQGIKKAAPEINEYMKSKIRIGKQPEVYEDQGTILSAMLKASGLDAKMNPGELKNGWNQMINSNIYKTGTLSTRFRVFDSTILDTSSKWWGVGKKGIIYAKRLKSDSPRNNSGSVGSDKLKAQKSGIIADGYRPLPGPLGMTWVKNPYKKYGYWMLYEKGYMSSLINYEKSNFIADSYRGIVTKPNQVVTETPTKYNIALDLKMIMQAKIATNTNKILRTKAG